MKKWLLLVLVIILAVVVFTPYGFGFMIEKNYKNILTQIPHSKVQIKIVDYQRGWFSSNAKLKISFNMPKLLEQKAKVKPLTFFVNETINHGPLIIATNPDGDKRLVIGQAFILGLVKQPNVNGYAITLIHLHGSVDNHLLLYNVNFGSQQQGFVYAIHDLNAHTNISSNLKTVEGNVKIAAIDFLTKSLVQHSDNINVDFHLKKSPSGMYLGKTNAQLQKQAGLVMQRLQFQLNNVRMSSDSNEVDGKINYALQLSMKNILLNNQNYGPANLYVTVDKLDAEKLLALQNKLQVIKANETITKQELKQYSSAIMQLLSKGLNLNIKQLNLILPEGKLAAHANIKINPQPLAINNPIVFLANLDVNANLEIPKVFLQNMMETFATHVEKPKQTKKGEEKIVKQEKTPAEIAKDQINQWLHNGMLIADGDNYKINVSFNQMQLLVNGKPPKNKEMLKLEKNKEPRKNNLNI